MARGACWYVETPAPGLRPHEFPAQPERTLFDSADLPPDFQWLRSPWPDELFSLTARPGRLRLYGRDSPGGFFRQSLVARRQQAHCFSAATRMEFEPEHFQQMAGLIYYTIPPSSTTCMFRTMKPTAGTCVPCRACLMPGAARK